MKLHGENILGGRPSKLGKTKFQAFNPATQSKLEPAFFEASEAEVNEALEIAAAAFQQYRRKSAAQIAAFLEQIGTEIGSLGEVLIQRAHEETALPEARLLGERARTIDQLRQFAQTVREGSWVNARIDRAVPDRKPAPKPDVRRMLIPIGPVAVFGASNFPLAFSVAGGDTASALAAGNPVVVKAHPAHPGTSELTAGAIQTAVEKAGMPSGVFSMLHGMGATVGLNLARHPLTRAVAFTGSLKAGRALFDAACSRPEPIPCFAEMGSTNPIVVLPGALQTRTAEIAKGLVQSVTLGVGQFCTNPGLVVGIAGESLKEFASQIAKLMEQTPLGTMLNQGICESYWEGIERTRRVSGVSLAGKPNLNASREKLQAPPMLFVTDEQTFLKNPELAEEIFGPMTLLVGCSSIASLQHLVRTLPGQLTMTIHGTDGDLAEIHELLDLLADRAGRLVFNGFPTGVEVCASMHHGGPYPAATDAASTSVGNAAILRFARPVCYQNFPQEILPIELRDKNERKIWRLLDNQWTQANVGLHAGITLHGSGKNSW